MKTILLAILGLSIAIVSCASHKGERAVAKKYEEIAQAPDKEERIESLKRHDRW